MTALTTQMYEIANKLVDVIGPATNTELSITKEPYICFRYATPNIKDVKHIWSTWIQSYVFVTQFSLPEGLHYHKNDAITIYWRKKPEIKKDDEDGLFYVYARLLLSRRDISTRVTNINSAND